MNLILYMLLIPLFAQPPGQGGNNGGSSGEAPGGDSGSSGDDSSSSAEMCATDGSDYNYVEAVNGATRTVTVNACPNHPTLSINPGYPVNADTEFSMPAYPVLEASSTIDLSMQANTVGVAFSSGYLWSPFAGGQSSGANYADSAAGLEGDTFDSCGGHAASQDTSTYHYHIPPYCLLKQLGQTTDNHSPQIGWALDGFPVYGNRGPNGVLLQACSANGNVSPCVDECNGMAFEDSALDDFVYRYYFLGAENDGESCDNPVNPFPAEDYHPHSPLCYKGCCPSGATCSSFIPACSSDISDGFTSSYTADVKYPAGLDSVACDACWESGESGEVPASCSDDTTSGTDEPTEAGTSEPTVVGATNEPTTAVTSEPTATDDSSKAAALTVFLTFVLAFATL